MALHRLTCSSIALAATLSAVALLAACARPAMAPGEVSAASPTSIAESAPADPEGALAQLDLAEADLAAALGLGAPLGAAAAEPPEAKQSARAELPPIFAPPPPHAPPPPDPTVAPGEAPASSAKDARAPSRGAPDAPSRGAARPQAEVEASSDGKERQAPPPCERACRALASMRRAADHLCALAGDADARCGGARGRVQSAGERVRAACPACSGGEP